MGGFISFMFFKYKKSKMPNRKADRYRNAALKKDKRAKKIMRKKTGICIVIFQVVM